MPQACRRRSKRPHGIKARGYGVAVPSDVPSNPPGARNVAPRKPRGQGRDRSAVRRDGSGHERLAACGLAATGGHRGFSSHASETSTQRAVYGSRRRLLMAPARSATDSTIEARFSSGTKSRRRLQVGSQARLSGVVYNRCIKQQRVARGRMRGSAISEGVCASWSGRCRSPWRRTPVVAA